MSSLTYTLKTLASVPFAQCPASPHLVAIVEMLSHLTTIMTEIDSP